MGLDNINYCKDYSETRLAKISTQLSKFEDQGICVVANGSYARLEAHQESDFDYFILMEPDNALADQHAQLQKEISDIIQTIVSKPPSVGGAFNTVEKCGSFGTVIGGDDDSNGHITRRILFLIEGRPLCGKQLFDREKQSLLDRYIARGITDHQLALFLLNDIIRYYRTICVDFEHKTGAKGKPWGTRNIKLIFSRKLLYFGGVLVAAEAYQRTRNDKIAIASQLMEKSAIERMQLLCRESAMRALEEYDHFLGELMIAEVRRDFENVTQDRETHTERFKQLKNRGHHFTMHLISALKATYPEAHPIHRALLM